MGITKLLVTDQLIIIWCSPTSYLFARLTITLFCVMRPWVKRLYAKNNFLVKNIKLESLMMIWLY